MGRRVYKTPGPWPKPVLEVPAMSSLAVLTPRVNATRQRTAVRPPARPPQHLPHRQRKPLPPVPVTGSFGEGTTQAELIAGTAVLEIARPEDTNDFYWVAYVIDGGRVVGVNLRKFGTGQTYFLPATLDDCDCADATFRQRPCKHAIALRQALSPLAK
jgi:hypothetical protein